jgi:undecaprenyl-diphosphatase
MLVTQVIKHIATRPRPALWVSLRPEHTFSFPSGHAMDTAALAAALFFITPLPRRKWWALAPLFALSVGWARMYLGVHYPSDVLAGWSSGAGWVGGVECYARFRIEAGLKLLVMLSAAKHFYRAAQRGGRDASLRSA